MKKILTLLPALLFWCGMSVVHAATYTVAGSSTAFGSNWDPSDESNNMSLDGEVYKLVKENVTLSDGIEFKVCQDHGWNPSYPSSNYQLSISEAAVYTITVTFNESTSEVTGSAVKTGDAGPISATYTVAGSPAAFGTEWDAANTANDMTEQLDGTYKLVKENVTLSGDVELKVCKDHGWANSWPSENYILSITKPAVYTVTVTFNAATKEVSATAEEDTGAEPVPSFTFAAGTTVYFDFTAYGAGVNLINDATWKENVSSVIGITMEADWVLTASTDLFKSEASGWSFVKCSTLPTEGQNMLVSTDGATYHWDTYVPSATPPTVKVKGSWDEWAEELAFTVADDGLSASATKNLAAGNYEFKVVLGEDDWRANGHTYHRGYTGASGITVNGDNMVLQTDAEGDYVITWTYATNAISITFPEAPAEVEEATVRFFAPRSEGHVWEHVYAYAWRRTDNAILSAEWPGDEVSSSKSEGWYSYTVEKGASVIFSDGAGMQTHDIDNIQADVCYVANHIDAAASESDPIKVAFASQCEVDYYLTGDEALTGSDWNASQAELKLDENHQIVLSGVPAGVYEFKITNGSWAWSIGGKEHLQSGCSGVAATSGSGNVKFKTTETQDITISYDPATEKICLGATTVEPYEEVRTGLESGRYYTVCLSKAVSAVRGASFWTLQHRNEAGSEVYLEEEQAPFEAGKPFIMLATSDRVEAIYTSGATSTPVENGALRGTLEDMTYADLQAKGSVYLLIQNAIRPLASGNYLSAGRAYIDYEALQAVSEAPKSAPGRRVAAMPMQRDSATGIGEVRRDDVRCTKVMENGVLYLKYEGTMYDVQGRRVER